MGGDDEDGARAEAERQDRTVAGGEEGEGLVEGRLEEVEVADYWEGGRTRWVFLLVFVVVVFLGE